MRDRGGPARLQRPHARSARCHSRGWCPGVAAGDQVTVTASHHPALPNTGALVKAHRDGTFTVVTDGLNQPTSLEFIKNTAYVVTLGGEIWKIGR
jgi:hypothetical protein